MKKLSIILLLIAPLLAHSDDCDSKNVELAKVELKKIFGQSPYYQGIEDYPCDGIGPYCLNLFTNTKDSQQALFEIFNNGLELNGCNISIRYVPEKKI